jgi:hypothetical protein
LTHRFATRGAALACALIAAAPPPAHAWVRTRGCHDCPELYWCERIVTWITDGSGAGGIAANTLADAARRSFSQWDAVSCADIVMLDGGTANGRSVGYRPTAATNENLVVVVDEAGDWHHTSVQIAVTTTSFNPRTGEILDADIELNAVDFEFATDGRADRMDLRNTLTHEVGHVLGFDHSAVPQATMHGSAPLGDTNKRDLHNDDVDAACTVYPIDAPTPGSRCGDGAGGGGCTCRAGAAEAPWVAGLAVAVLLRVRAGRARRRSN